MDGLAIFLSFYKKDQNGVNCDFLRVRLWGALCLEKHIYHINEWGFDIPRVNKMYPSIPVNTRK
jgi:hypothetical protein